MKWVNNIGKVVFKALAFLPCFFTVANYFTVLTEKQRTEPMGIFFLVASIVYFLLALYLLIINWQK